MKKDFFRSVLMLLITSLSVYGNELMEAKILKFTEENSVLFKNTETMDLLQKFRNGELDSQGKDDLYALFINQVVSTQKKWYITDRDIIDILITALDKSNSDTVRTVSARFLSKKVLPADIENHSKEIYAALNLKDFFLLIANHKNISREYGDFLMLIGRLNDLSEKERNMIFGCTDIPLFIKAKIGDINAEQAIVQDFIKEEEYEKKALLAMQLGYIASPLSIKTLLGELSSSVKIEWLYGEVSIRFDIINALKFALPHEEIFDRALENLSVGRFSASPERDKARKEYAEQVNDWSLKKYQIKVWDPDTVWFKYSYDTPIINGVPIR